ncbi:MAG: gas vesicle protein GvpD P-loop domain-containing protein, partial [Thermoplasmataceae archaeon]
MAKERNDGLFTLMERFFSQPYGKSLVIKGKPGAGKTTLALSFMEAVMQNIPVCYLSARFSDSSLLSIYPWLEKASLRSSGQASDPVVNISTESLKKLERLIEEGKVGSEINNGLILNVSDLLPEIRGIYEFVDSNVGRSPLIVIDSIEALSEKYDIESQLLFSVLYGDIVERSEGNIIFILEATENPKLEYFADGVISMDYSIVDDFLVRTATIEKLRGISIGSSPKFLYTLNDGKCRAFSKNQVIYPDSKIELAHDDITDQFYVPIGSSDFHKLTIDGEGQVSLGSVIILHRQGNSDDVDTVVNLFKNNLIK